MEKNFYKMLKNKIKENRARLNITQATAAKEIGVSRVTFCKIENGATPNLITAMKLADIFEITVDNLFKITEHD